jgi:hypothetical protein
MEDFLDSDIDILAGLDEDERKIHPDDEDDDVDAVSYDKYDDEDAY